MPFDVVCLYAAVAVALAAAALLAPRAAAAAAAPPAAAAALLAPPPPPPSCAAVPAVGKCYKGDALAPPREAADVGACCAACAARAGCAAYSLATAINPDGSGGRGLCSLFGAKAKRGNGNCLSQSSVDGPGVLPALPENRYGPYASSGDANKGVEYPFIAGYDTADCAWKNVEPARGRFNWTACRNAIAFAAARGKVVMVNPQTGSKAPVDWLPTAGVPTALICDHNWKKNVKDCPADMREAFPFYLAPAYYGLWRNYHQQLHDFVKGLPTPLREAVTTVQVSLGCTGDITPWHGTAIDPKYRMPGGNKGTTWKALWVNGTAAMIDIWTDLLPTTKLLFNAIPPTPAEDPKHAWPEYRHLIMDVLQPPNFAAKFGVESHQYFTNYELDHYRNQGAITRTPYTSKFTGEVDFVRSRGEMSDGNPKDGPGRFFWGYPTWNMMGSACWCLTFGLDVLNPNPQVWSKEEGRGVRGWSPKIWAAFEHYAVYAGRKVPEASPGAWIQLRDALDATDTVRFPEKEYGDATVCGSPKKDDVKACAKRVTKIVAAFADQGAIVQDMTAATGGTAGSRNRLGLNDVGLRIWPTNYGQFMTQADPVGQSVGRWHVGKYDAGPLGNFARMTDSSAGKTNMTFALDRGVFNTTEAFGMFNSTALYLRVGYFDEVRATTTTTTTTHGKNKGSWQLHVGYSKPGQGQGITYTQFGAVAKGNSGEWIEARVTLDAASVPSGFSLRDVSHLVLSDADHAQSEGEGAQKKGADDDTFGWVEVSKIPFTYNLTERMVNMTAL